MHFLRKDANGMQLDNMAVHKTLAVCMSSCQEAALTCQQAAKSCPALKAYFFLTSSSMPAFCLSRAALSGLWARRAAVSCPILKLLKASAMTGTGMYLYGWLLFQYCCTTQAVQKAVAIGMTMIRHGWLLFQCGCAT